MAILSQTEINQIINDVREVVEDIQLSTTISYKKSGSTVSTWNPTTGTIPDMYSTSSVSAFKGAYRPEEVEKSGGLIEMTDVKFVIMRSDVSGVLSIDDMICEAGSNYQSATTYQIKYINRDPLAIIYAIQARAI